MVGARCAAYHKGFVRKLYWESVLEADFSIFLAVQKRVLSVAKKKKKIAIFKILKFNQQ